MFFADRESGAKVYYEVHGQGPPVVLLHHGFGSLEMWREICPRLAAAGFRVITYDRPGYGRSADGEIFTRWSVTSVFRSANVEVLERLADYLDLDAFYLVGQCEGGVIAADYAARFPGRAAGLATSSTLCRSRTTMDEFNRDRFPDSFSGLEPEMRDKLVKWHGREYAEEFYRRGLEHGGAYGRDRFDLRPVLNKVSCPALVLYPDRSSLFEVEQGVLFYRSLPAGELAVLPRCGHNTYEQQPDEYVRQIVAFIDRSRITAGVEGEWSGEHGKG